MNWVLITIVGLVGLIVLVKAKEIRHHLFYRILGVVVVLFLFSAVYILLKSGSSLTSYDSFLSFGKTYYSWLGSLFGNAKGITWYAGQQEWGFNSTVVP